MAADRNAPIAHVDKDPPEGVAIAARGRCIALRLHAPYDFRFIPCKQMWRTAGRMKLGTSNCRSWRLTNLTIKAGVNPLQLELFVSGLSISHYNGGRAIGSKSFARRGARCAPLTPRLKIIELQRRNSGPSSLLRHRTMLDQKLLEKFRVPPGAKVRLKDYDPGWAQTPEVESRGKKEVKQAAQKILEENIRDLDAAQELLYADDRYAVLIIFQAMDAAGKDGTIKHVMSGLNPQGTQVFSFKKPSDEDLEH